MVFGRLISAIGMLSIISILVGNSAMANAAISHNLKSASFAVTLNTNSFSGRDKPANSKVLNVVTSVAPIANIVKNIAGDKIGLNQLIPDGIDSHTFELTPSGAVKVQNADLVIINGLHLESGVEKVSNASRAHNPNQQLLKLADNTINRDQRIYDFSFPKEKGDPNPHLWLNVANAMNYANLTKNKLIQMDPGNAAYYKTNTDKYLALLKKLDVGIKSAVQTIPPQNRKLLTYHDSWAYFAPRYGMIVIGAVQPSDFGEPKPQEVAKLIDQVRNEKVPALFGSEVFPSKVMDQIGKEGNVKYVNTLADDVLPGKPTDPNHTYVGMMLQDMNGMIIPLGGNVSALSGINPANTFVHSSG
ncbi:MAG: metal ABC transporter substrate-binding protein [Nitrososphaeraceae archaeon]